MRASASVWPDVSHLQVESNPGLQLTQLSHRDELTLTEALTEALTAALHAAHTSLQLHTPINIFDTFLCNPDTRHAGRPSHSQRGADGLRERESRREAAAGE